MCHWEYMVCHWEYMVCHWEYIVCHWEYMVCDIYPIVHVQRCVDNVNALVSAMYYIH